jgi:plasmid stabilization system protein ParE
MKTVRVLPEVYEDLAEATGYYFQRAGREVSNRLIDSFNEALDRVPIAEEVRKPVYRSFQRVLLRGFPYKLYFAAHDETIIVTLLIHGARSPHLVQRLLSERRRA